MEDSLSRPSRRRWLTVALAVVCLNSIWAPAAAQTNSNDVLALLNLKQAWGNAMGWSGSDPCANTWDGVICIGNRVTSLLLISRGLAGSIPSTIGNLTALNVLDLSFNHGLRGTIPKELGSLTALNYLSLQKCSLTGTIPDELGKLTNLNFLALNNNKFGGGIPSALGALKNLTWFDVGYNNLNGSLPVSTSSSDGLGIDSWPNIQHYHLNNNQFTGQIPLEIGIASNVLHMLLENNQFSGPIPDTLGNMKSLQILYLHSNQLSGHIPSTLNKIVSTNTSAGLHQIRVGGNKLTGTIPVLDALNQLEYVDFSNNSFDPQVFPSWLNLSSKSLETIIMENSSLIGPLPADLLAYPALQGLYLSNNYQINESLIIPSNLGQELRYVFLQNNKILSIQYANANIGSLEIQLAGNPACAPGGLATASATVCNATTTTPATSWTSPLDNNCPSCEPKSRTANPNTCLCSYPLIVTLEIRAPTFSTIDNDTLWATLAFQTNNSFHARASNVKFVTDQLWVQSAYLNSSTEKVNVLLYFFPLSGDTMDKATEAFIKNSFTLQKVAYTSPFKPDIVQDITNSEVMPLKVSGRLVKGAIIGIAVGAGVVAMLIALLGFLAVKHKRRAEDERKRNPFAAWGKVENGQAPQLKGAHWFSFDDIKRMTNNFNDDNELGAGGYGKVYKGIQAGTGAMLAVKRAQEGSKQGAQEFKNEIELLSRVHHNNLVGLVGFCFEKAEQMLVYEFMPNGTLTDWLRGDRSDPPLEWDRRLLIALGAARGLAYLHDHADPPIIHRDVKSCNILLDKNLNAKVADFGLSMLVPEKDGSFKPTIKGTMGYLDPEYYMTSVLSTKSDVYSFGVVLLEIVTGRPPVSHGGHVVREVRNRYNRSGVAGVDELLDPALGGTRDDELETFLNIALACVEDSSLERPSMYMVVKQLEALVGPKAQLMPGNEHTLDTRRASRDRRVPLEMMSGVVSDDFEPASGQFSQASSGSQQSSFKYSGGFAPLPVQPK